MAVKQSILAILFILTFMFSASFSANAIANNFNLTILSQQHDFTTHNVTIEIKNLQNINNNFNLQLLFSNLSFLPSQMKNVQIYELKSLNTSFPTPTTQLVEANSTYPKNITDFKYSKGCWNETKSEKVFPCNVTKITGTGVEWKMLASWKPTKMQLVNSEKNVSTSYGNINIAKSTSKCDADDFNTTLNCNGTKRFQITWETPVATSGSGWGSEGYYEVLDANTGISYDPPWGNITFTKRLEVNFTNPDSKDHLNERVMFHLGNNSDILKFTQASFQDIRITNRSGSAIPHQKVYYSQNDTRADALAWWINNTAGATVSYSIYFNSSTALDANSTLYTRYEFFENQSIYMNGGFTPFESDTGGLYRNTSTTHNITNVTSLSAGQSIAVGGGTGEFRHNGIASPSKDVNGSFIISWWQMINSTNSFVNGIQQTTGPNVWGLVTDAGGAIAILNGSNGINNYVITPHNITANTWNWFELEKNDTGEYYWFANTTGKFFLGADTALSENYSNVVFGIQGGGTGGPLFEDFLIQQNVAGFGAQYNEYPIGSYMTLGPLENVTACQTISATQNITATNSINNAGNAQCIIIDAPNVIYDCASYTVDGTDAGSSIGFNVSSRADNTTIRNCIVRDWAEGIQTNARNTVLDNITALSNTAEGIFFGNNPQASGGLVTSSNISNNVQGINDRGSTTNIINTSIDANGLDGLIFTSKNVATANYVRARWNGRSGISSSGGSGHTVINSIMTGNDRYGWEASGATGEVSYNNTYQNNIWGGVMFVTGSTISTFVNQTFQSNTYWDLNLTNTAGGVDLINLDFTGHSNITIQHGLSISIKNISVGGIPANPSNDYVAIGQWLNITNVSGTATLYINMTYLASDIPAGFAEGNLSWAKYNGTAWQNLTSNFANTYGVDTVNNVVWANITNFTGQMGGVVFAPLVNNISIAAAGIVNVTNISYVAPTEANITYKNFNWIQINVTAQNFTNITISVFNSSGLFNTSYSTVSAFYVNVTNMPSGNYTFNATATNSSNGQVSTDTRLIVIDTILPTAISFVSPTPNNQTDQNWNNTFVNITATDINLANNMSVTFFNSSGFFNTTNVTAIPTGSINFFQYNFTDMRDGNYSYNGTVYDKAGNVNFTETRQIIIDTALTNIDFGTLTDTNQSRLNRNFVQINISSYDINLANLTITVYNSAGLYNETTRSSVTSMFLNFTGIADGNYTFNGTATDKANNRNYTTLRQVLVDTVLPIPLFIGQTEANNTGKNVSFVLVNVSTTEINLANISITLYNETGLMNTSVSTVSPFFMNFTALNVDGNYTFNATATDIVNNINYSVTRFVILDRIRPNFINLSLPTPDNQSTISGTVTLNVSANDTNIRNITIYMNGTNALASCTATPCSFSWNTNTIGNGNVTLNATVTDVADNMNSSETRVFVINNVATPSGGGGGGGGITISPPKIAAVIKEQVTSFKKDWLWILLIIIGIWVLNKKKKN